MQLQAVGADCGCAGVTASSSSSSAWGQQRWGLSSVCARLGADGALRLPANGAVALVGGLPFATEPFEAAVRTAGIALPPDGEPFATYRQYRRLQQPFPVSDESVMMYGHVDGSRPRDADGGSAGPAVTDSAAATPMARVAVLATELLDDESDSEREGLGATLAVRGGGGMLRRMPRCVPLCQQVDVHMAAEAQKAHYGA